MKEVVAAVRRWLAQNNHPAIHARQPVKVQLVFHSDRDAYEARHHLMRELDPDYHFAIDKPVTVEGLVVELCGPTIHIER